jgi:hypothetical protein
MKEKIKKILLLIGLIISAPSILLGPTSTVIFSEELEKLNPIIQEIIVFLSIAIPFIITIILFEKLNPLIKKRKILIKGKDFVIYDKHEYYERKY